MSADMWQRCCVVGVGSHARNKLIPALLANGQQIAGLVSAQSPELLPWGPVYSNIEAALVALPADIVFIIATPPSMHFEQVKRAVEAGRDVIVEKPAFVSAHDAREIAALSKNQGTIVVEGLMYRYTALYRRLLDYWETHRKRIDALDAVFLIPNAPAGTFRQESAIASSCLYDMGCYVISLLADLRLPLDGLQLLNVSHISHGQEEVNIVGVLGGVKISIRIGVASTYQNVVGVRTLDSEIVRFWPFFYGRPSERCITHDSHDITNKELLEDGDSFQAMFAVPRSQWLMDHNDRLTQMIEVATSLERLGQELLVSRKAPIKSALV